MTLIELLLVIALVSLIVGIGLGMFASLNPGQRTAVGIVQNVIRSAQNGAVARSAPARVSIDARDNTLTAEVMQVVGTWQFESERFEGAFGLDGALVGGGRLDEDGYRGKALTFEGELPGAKWEAQVQGDPAFDLSRGFTVEFALRVDEASSARILAIGESVFISINSLLGIETYFLATYTDDLGSPQPAGRAWLRTDPGVLEAGRWNVVRLVYDRRILRCLIDGVVVAALRESARVLEVEKPLVIGGGRSLLRGAIDNLVVSAVAAEDVVTLPEGVRFASGTPREIYFAAGGGLDAMVHTVPVPIRLLFEEGDTSRLQVNLYGTVE